MNTDPILPNYEVNEILTDIIDIEAQIRDSEEKINDVQINLKGILKKPSNIEDNIETEEMIYRICFSSIALIILTPIIVCDLYFGFTDNSCSNEEPNELAINLKLYLIVSGFVGLSSLIIILIAINCIKFNNDNAEFCEVCSTCLFTSLLGLIIIFNYVWNILGAVVFWGYIYGNNNCNKSFSTYLFVSLILKLLGNLYSSKLNNKKNDKK